MLTPVETFWLSWLADHGPEADAHRARILLLAAKDAPAEAIAAALGIPPADAVAAVGQFARHGLSDFPRPSLTVDELLAAAQVDLAHAHHVAELAVALFDFTLSLHRLPARLRRAVELAGLLHNAGLALDAPNHHTVGRDLLHAVDLDGVPATTRRVMACAVGFHRKKVRPEADPGFTALTDAHRRQALAIAALLRVADGLDYSQSQSTELLGVVITPEVVTLRLDGPEVATDGARALKKADLWEEVFHLPLRTTVARESAPGAVEAAELPLTPEALTSDVVRRALGLHLQRWQVNESAAVNGDTTAVKAVRVSARRMRAVLVVFKGLFKKKRIRRITDGLREIEQRLGRVRNVDVLLADVQEYHAALRNKAEAAHVAALVAAWEKSREQALAEAETWLGSPAAADLQADLAAFIVAPPLGADDPPLAQGAVQVVQTLVERVASRQAKVAHDKPRTYHRLRLALKRLRYTLEFLQPALGAGVDALLTDLVRVQDRLGALNDARLFEREIARYLDEHAVRQAKHKAPQLEGAQGVLAYSQARRGLWAQRLKEFDRDWAPVRVTKLKPRVGAVLKALKPSRPENRSGQTARVGKPASATSGSGTAGQGQQEAAPASEPEEAAAT